MIRAILFDADGVLQRSPRFPALIAEFVPPENRREFAQAIFDAEQPCLRGTANFRDNLIALLARWNLESHVDAVVDVFHDIEPDEGVLECVATVRGCGVLCAVASNQQASRAHYMSTQLGYRQRFDHEFYSHAVGAVKPEAEYFLTILSVLQLPAYEVLFIDDSLPNVEAARKVGITSEHFPSSAGHDHLRRLLTRYDLPGVLPSRRDAEV